MIDNGNLRIRSIVIDYENMVGLIELDFIDDDCKQSYALFFTLRYVRRHYSAY